jgi:predicted ATPase
VVQRFDDGAMLTIGSAALWLELSLNDAEDHFRRGLEYARSQEVAGWELRAATSLARLWHAPQRTRQARTLLLPVYRRFTEGLKTADLLDAKALLDTLRL